MTDDLNNLREIAEAELAAARALKRSDMSDVHHPKLSHAIEAHSARMRATHPTYLLALLARLEAAERVLPELYARMVKARVDLRFTAGDVNKVTRDEALRLYGKSEGVDLAASYVAESMRALAPQPTAQETQ